VSPDPLLEVLEEGRRRGFLGPGPVHAQLRHAEDLALAIGPFKGAFLDLGSGGGVPGLVLAMRWPDARGALLDAHRKRCAFLRDALTSLGLEGRVGVECGRAEVLARSPRLREQFDIVVARAFAAPAVTAECAVGFLVPGGRLVVTEPPAVRGEGAHPERWPAGAVGQLGFSDVDRIRHGDTGAVVLPRPGHADERWPRREGVPGKRPLW
jgi:16S rRNA (guanine527-N7)-methyltransferase